MKFKLTQALFLMAIAALFMTSCDNSHPGFKKSDTGVYYQILSHDANAPAIKADSGMFFKLSMSYGTVDSLIFDANQTSEIFELPYTEPMFKGDINDALALLSVGDSAVFIIKADSFFLKTAQSPEVPELFKENNDLYFWVNVHEILTMEQLEAVRLEELEERKAQELADLAVFLSKNYPDAVPTSTGMFIIENKLGKGKKPIDGDILTFDFSVSLLNGEVLYDSKQAGRPMEATKGQAFDTEGFSEGLNTMRVGDDFTMVVPSKLAFGEQGRQGLIPPYTALVYTANLTSVKTKSEHEKELAAQKAMQAAEEAQLQTQENITIANYIKENKITVSPSESGLYYIETAQGTGEQPVAGDKVKVHYHGTLLDGTKFDSSYDRGTPFEFALDRGQVIKGWDEALAMMKVGGKATIIVPSSIGYGARSRGDIIHAYAPLKFEVELIEVIKAE